MDELHDEFRLRLWTPILQPRASTDPTMSSHRIELYFEAVEATSPLARLPMSPLHDCVRARVPSTCVLCASNGNISNELRFAHVNLVDCFGSPLASRSFRSLCRLTTAGKTFRPSST